MEVEGCEAEDRRVRWPVHALFLLECVQGLDCCDPVHSERDRFSFSLLTLKSQILLKPLIIHNPNKHKTTIRLKTYNYNFQIINTSLYNTIKFIKFIKTQLD